MTLHGMNIIGGRTSAMGSREFRAFDAATGKPLEPACHEATAQEIATALLMAQAAAGAYARKSPEEIAAFLEAIAGRIEAIGPDLIQRAHIETALAREPRLAAELVRTIWQFRLFAQIVRDGNWVQARIDRPDAQRKPLPKPDVRRMLLPLGPVVIFGASNFPLAISSAGGDVAAALAVGCPVVVKGHPAHPGTEELLAGAVVQAMESCGIEPGVYSLLHGAGPDVGMGLVRNPLTQAVAFTGSLRGGRALFDAAAARPEPIPVYAEMGSINPVFILPGAMRERADQIAAGYVASVNLGVGQFCTRPGLLVGFTGATWDSFLAATSRAASDVAGAPMLHGGIREAYARGIERLGSTAGLSVAAGSPDQGSTGFAACVLFTTQAAAFLAQPYLSEEVFGPSSILVSCQADDQMRAVAESLPGSLTGTIHGSVEDLRKYQWLVRILERKVGRILFNGFPTGVEVGHAMQHGGPYPATTHSHFTSIGTAGLERFTRPVCYQGFPDEELPEPLQNRNPRHLLRMVDGKWTREPVG